MPEPHPDGIPYKVYGGMEPAPTVTIKVPAQRLVVQEQESKIVILAYADQHYAVVFRDDGTYAVHTYAYKMQDYSKPFEQRQLNPKPTFHNINSFADALALIIQDCYEMMKTVVAQRDKLQHIIEEVHEAVAKETGCGDDDD